LTALMKVAVSFAESMDMGKDLVTTKKLGQGKFEVYLAHGASACEEYALKVFPRNEFSKTCFNREKDLLSSLDHPHIIKSFPLSHHDADFDLIVMEHADHGDFFDLVTRGSLAHEVHVRTYFHQLIAGLEYLHSQGIAHLDLKLENLLMSRDFLLKIIDFDQAQTQSDHRVISGGTNGYRAPEIRERNCTNIFAADIYSAGILLYVLKTSKFPFMENENDSQSELPHYDLFLNNNEEFWQLKTEGMNKPSDFFSEELKQLLRGMLEKDPSKRLTIQDIKASEWYRKPILSPDGLKFHMGRVYQRMHQK